MKTLKQFSDQLEAMPLRISWQLNDLARMQGRQELYTRQSPQRLKVLRESAIIESAISSNRIENIQIAPQRIAAVLKSKQHLQDRNEEEVRNYQEVLMRIHSDPLAITPTAKTVLSFHAQTRAGIWDAGLYKEKPVDIIEKLPGGDERIRFSTVAPDLTPAFTEELHTRYAELLRDATIPPLVLLAAYNLDLLCIHPFRDGNGRVSRLLWLLQLYHLGFEVGRYISIERVIEANKDLYYETLEKSSKGWHEGAHDPWPYIGFVLYVIKEACAEFEERVGDLKRPRGEKSQMVRDWINRQQSPFSVSEIQSSCPGVSVDLIRSILKKMAESGDAVCLGRGPGATWKIKGN